MGDSTREPCDDDEADAPEATEAPLLRRLLKRGRRRGDDDSTREPRDDNSTKPPRDSDATREPKDVTRGPCEGDDCRRKRHRGRGRGRKDDSDSTEEPTTDIPLRRLLQEEVSEETDDSTKEPCDNTREPCEDGEDCHRGRKGHKGRRKGRKGGDVTTEAPEEIPALRRALGGRGSGRRGGLDAIISNGSVDFAGVTGEVVFGD